MKKTHCSVRLVWVIIFSLFAGCTRHEDATAPKPQASGQETRGSSETHSGSDDRVSAEKNQQDLNALLAESRKEYEQMVRHPEIASNRPPSEWPFPNFQTGPGRPLPNYQNFYSVDDRFPSYLLCEFPVEEKPYVQSNEPDLIRRALEQIRGSGPEKFPPIKWIAVAIRNVAEHKGASTFEESFKVGTIFKASDVFDQTRSLTQLVAGAQIDRHPFYYDVKQPTPGEQQRWVIVEHHAATNHVDSGAPKTQDR